MTVPNRFTPSAFDKAQSVYVADGVQLTAKYFCKGRTWCAELKWKPRYERAQTSITTLTDSDMKSALLRLDSTLKFLGHVDPNTVPVETLADKNADMLEAMRLDTANVSDRAYISACQRLRVKPQPRNAPSNIAQAIKTAPVLSAQDAAALEGMRTDPTVSDERYRSAARKFGVQPQPRPARGTTGIAPQAIAPTITQSVGDWSAFETAHGELFQPPYGLLNLRTIESWFADEGVQWTAANLATCYSELKAAGNFRDARTLSRDLNGSLQIAQPYSRERILQLRNQQVVGARDAAPSNLSEVDREAWNAVRAKYPQLPVNSAGFKKCCSDTVLLWARTEVLEAYPELEAANKRSELRAAVDKQLMIWAKQGNPNSQIGARGNTPFPKETRIWLG